MFERTILLTGPSVNDRETANQPRACPRILGQWQQLASAATFAHRVLLSPESGVDPTEKAPGLWVIGLIACELFLNRAGRGEGGSRCGNILKGSSGPANEPFAWKNKVTTRCDPLGRDCGHR